MSSQLVRFPPHFFIDFCLDPVVPFSRFDGGILLGPLPIVTSIPLVSVPNPHLGASSLVFSCDYTLVFSCAYPLVLPFSHWCVFMLH